jgi:hypothetical protein
MAAAAERMKMMRQRRRARAARIASRRCRPALAGGATAAGEAGRRPRSGSRARRDEMDRIGRRVWRRCGDPVTVAATGDYGKPRPAVIARTDAFPVKDRSFMSSLTH